MASHEIVNPDRNPFLRRSVKSKQTKAERAGASIGFEEVEG